MNQIDVTKKPNQKSRYSEKDAADLLLCADDPMYFIRNFMKIQHPIKGSVPFVPYPYQDELIAAFHENRFSVGLTARQMGKCVAAATKITVDGSLRTIGNLFDSLSPRTLHRKIVDWLEARLVELSRQL